MAIETIVALVQQHGPQLLTRLVDDGGLTRPEAERFVPAAASALVRALEKRDAGPVAAGDVDALRERFDLGALAAKAKLDEPKTGAALAAFLPAVLELGGPRTGALADLFGGASREDAASAASSIAKKFFSTP